MDHLIFVYGTLKEGFRNHAINEGTRLPGVFTTVEELALYVIGPRYLPWLVRTPGVGGPVQGELYRVNDAALARMDALEELDRADWYARLPLQVRDEAGKVWACQAYLGSPARLAMETVHVGPVPAYTQAHALEREHALRAAGAL